MVLTMNNDNAFGDVTWQLQDNKYAKTGYSFTGWNTKADGTGTKYSDKQVVTISKNLTLYAQWEQEYEIKKYSYITDKKYIDKIDVNTTCDEIYDPMIGRDIDELISITQQSILKKYDVKEYDTYPIAYGDSSKFFAIKSPNNCKSEHPVLSVMHLLCLRFL